MASNKVLTVLTIVAALGLWIMETDSISLPQQQVAGDKSFIGQCASGFKNSSAQICKNLVDGN